MRRDIEAALTFLWPNEGGRSSPTRTGYRGQLFYDDHDWDAIYEFPDTAVVNPGDSVRAYLTLLFPAAHEGRLTPDKEIEIREGSRIVARGRVTEVIGLP